MSSAAGSMQRWQALIAETAGGGSGPADHVDGYLADTNTAALTDSGGHVTRWGKNVRPVWYTGTTWQAILPEGSSSDWTFFDDVADGVGGSVVVDTGNSSRIDAVYTSGTTYVLRGTSSGCLFSSYSAGSVVVNGATVPLASANLDASPIVLHRSNNGYLWAANWDSGNITVTRSTNSGSTWSTAQVVVDAADTTGAVEFTQVGNRVLLVASGNADVSGDRYALLIHQDASSYAAASWTAETLPSLPSGVTGDDHLSLCTLPDGRVVGVFKTTGADDSSDPLIHTVVRAPSGLWYDGATLETGPDSGVRPTRPSITCSENEVYVVYGSINSPQDLTIRKANISDLTTWSTATVEAGPGFVESVWLPRPEYIISADDDFPILTVNADEEQVYIAWITAATSGTGPFDSLPASGAITPNVKTANTNLGSGDVADTPFFVYNPTTPANTRLLGAIKSSGGGVEVYNLSGTRLSQYLIGAVNAISVRDMSDTSGWDNRVLVGASGDRAQNEYEFLWFNRGTDTLTSAGSSLAVGYEPYGTVLYKSPVSGNMYMFVTEATGGSNRIKQYQITYNSGTGTVSTSQVRNWTLPNLSEGMAVDERNGYLFIGTEDVALRRYDAEPGGSTSAQLTVDTVGGGHLVADIEGLTVAEPYGDQPGYLIASSQGNNTFHVYDLESPHTWRKSFTIGSASGILATQDTDGINILRKPLGGTYPDGAFAAHNANPSANPSYFTISDAADILGELPIIEEEPEVLTRTATGTLTLSGIGVVAQRIERTAQGTMTLSGTAVAVGPGIVPPIPRVRGLQISVPSYSLSINVPTYGLDT